MTDVPGRDQPGDRGAGHHRRSHADLARRRPTPRSSARGGAFDALARASRPATGPGCCAGSPRWSTRTSRSWRSSRWRNSGHTIGNARWEAGNVRDVLNYYAGAPERLFGRQIPVAGGLDVTFHEPLGVVGVIVPWNFPMPIAGWGFAPALAAGNTVVLKPAELTPLTAMRLGRAGAGGRAAGATSSPCCPGKGSVVGQRFVTHPAVRKVVLHRLDRGRQADHGRLRRPGEARDAGARRQEREHRLRRRRPREGGREPRPAASSTTPARTAARARGSWCRHRSYDRFLELLEPAVTGVPRARTRRWSRRRWGR